MDKKDFYHLHSELCKTLSHPKRQEILDILRDKEVSVNKLVEMTGMSQSNLSQHLAIMRSKGVLKVRQDGLYIHYSIKNMKILRAFDLISDVLKESIEDQNNMVKKVMGKRY